VTDAPAYLEIIRSRIRTAVVYRYNTLFFLLLMVLQVFILKKVWTALYDGRTSVDGLTLHALLVYLTIAQVQTWVLQDPTVTHYIYFRIREGQIAFDLVRPAGFVPQMFAHIVGSSTAVGAVAIVALPLVALVGVLSPPSSAQALVLYLVSLLLGYLLTAMLTLILGMVAFWTMEISGLIMLYLLVNQFFAGALIPVSMFPTPLRIVADLLPFQAITYGPVAIYVGQLTGTAAVEAIGVQLVWVVVLAVACRVIWLRAVHRVVVQGG
jgi:ABC-2 type transport system permease protein